MRTFAKPSQQWPRGCWPSETQTLLLRACFLEEDEACLRAWNEWRRRVPLDFVDGSSLPVLVLLHDRLRRLERPLPDMPRLAGIARFEWTRTQVLRRKAIDVLRILNGAAIDTIMLKGMALNATVYTECNRPMSDIDIVIRRRDIDASLKLLERYGWRPRFSRHRDMPAISHATHLASENNHNLDLHWDFFHEHFLTEERLDAFWKASRPIELGGQPTRVLCSADQLLHTCEHGARYDDTPPFRWLADAYQVVRKLGDGLDWERCLRLGQLHGLLPPVQQTLAYLNREIELALPTEARLLVAKRASVSSRLAQNLVARRQPGVHPLVRALPRNVLAYRRMRRNRPGVGLGKFLCLVNDLDLSPTRALVHFTRLTAMVTLASWRHAAGSVLERMRGWPSCVISMPSAGPEQVEGAYPPEIYGNQAFRWTEPVATMRVALEPSDYSVTLTLLPARDWTAANVTIVFNRTAVVCDRAEPSIIQFRLLKAMFADHVEQRLVLRCQPWSMAGSDLRPLGFPIVSIQFAAMMRSLAQQRLPSLRRRIAR